MVLALSSMILLNQNIQKYLVYTQLSLKSEVCPVVNNAIQFNVMSNQQNIQYTDWLSDYLSISCVLCSNADLLSIP